MTKPNFETTSGFLLNLMKFSATHLKSEADIINAFHQIRAKNDGILTESDVKPLENKFENDIPDNLKELASIIESMLD